MNFLQLQDLVLSWADDPAAGYITRPQLKVFLNNGLKEVQKKLVSAQQNWYIKCVRATLSVNEACYFLPQDFLVMHNFEAIVTAGTNVTEVKTVINPFTPREQTLIAPQTGLPLGYYIKKNQFNLKPIPDIAYEIEMLYSYRIAEMTADNEEPDMAEEWHEYIALIAAQDVWVKDREAMTELKEKSKAYEQRLIELSRQRQVDGPRQIVVTEDFDGLLF